MRSRIDRVLAERGITTSSSSLDVVRNTVLYEAEAIDAPTIAQLKREAGDSIRVRAFVELVDQPLAKLPVPAARGDLELVTSQTRGGASMSALGRFTLQYDAELRCLYLQGAHEAHADRVLPVWPFRYWATSSPVQLFDYDGKLAGEADATLELGGGEVEIQHIRTQ